MGHAAPENPWSPLRSAILVALGLGSVAGCETEFVPLPVQVDCDQATEDASGFVECGGVTVRRDTETCQPNPQCDGEAICEGCLDGAVCGIDPQGQCNCIGFCTTDADCPAEQACQCGAFGGQCVNGCKTSADCGDGRECVMFPGHEDPCGGGFGGGADANQTPPYYRCSSDNDLCLPGHGECDGSCVGVEGGFDCFDNTDTCDIGGRPFLIEGSARVSSVVNNVAWPAMGLTAATQIRADDRAVLADHWTRIGQLEHASIAAFARFAMQLMSLGAPPELLRETTSAMNDELHHARLAYGLASAYAGEAIGPGELSMRGALDESDLASIVRTLIDEGCIGETLAAHTAKEESERATDGAVGEVLARIARDEHQHSLLAWRSLAWMVEELGEPVLRVLAQALDRIEQELDEIPPTRRDGCGREEQRALARHGLLTSWEVMAARRQVLREVFLPVGRTLLRGEGQATRDVDARAVSRS